MFSIEKIEDYEKYPVHLSLADGEALSRIFTEKHLEKSNNRFFFYEYNGYRYFLFEEIMFEEDNYFLDLNRVLCKNFFLDREKI